MEPCGADSRYVRVCAAKLSFAELLHSCYRGNLGVLRVSLRLRRATRKVTESCHPCWVFGHSCFSCWDGRFAQYAQFPQQIVTELLLFARHRIRTSEIKGGRWICVLKRFHSWWSTATDRDREGEWSENCGNSNHKAKSIELWLQL